MTEAVAGDRVAAVAADPGYEQSGYYWSWGNRQQEGRKSFVQERPDISDISQIDLTKLN